VVRVALLRLLIAAGGHAAVAGAGRVQRRVLLTGPPADHSGWTLRSATWRAGPPQATAQTALAPPRPGREPVPKTAPEAGVPIGYARCSTDKQDLTAQRHALRQLGVSDDRLYLDHGMTGRNRRRPGLQQVLAAVRQGDTLVVPKLDRLARSVPDARAIGDSLAAGGVRLSIGGTVYDPADPMGKMFFNILATFAEFEVDLLGCARARGWRSLAQTAGSRARRPSSAPASAPMSSVWPGPAITRSPSWLNCFRLAARRSTASSPERAATRPDDRAPVANGCARTAFGAIEAPPGSDARGHPAAWMDHLSTRRFLVALAVDTPTCRPRRRRSGAERPGLGVRLET
jgi:hypothetical protein